MENVAIPGRVGIMAGASIDMRSDDAEAILHGLDRLGNAIFAPV
jgi:hypothetical protein